MSALSKSVSRTPALRSCRMRSRSSGVVFSRGAGLRAKRLATRSIVHVSGSSAAAKIR